MYKFSEFSDEISNTNVLIIGDIKSLPNPNPKVLQRFYKDLITYFLAPDFSEIFHQELKNRLLNEFEFQ